MHRRHFLQGLTALSAYGTLPINAQSGQPQRRLILIYLMGGNDGYNSLVPYTDKDYYAMRPRIAVPRDAVLRLSDHSGLHPMLAPILPAWEANELAVLQGIGLPEVHEQHYSDYERLVTGAADDEYRQDGWLSRALSPQSDTRDFDAVALDSLDIREGDPMGPFRGRKLKVVNAPHPSEVLAKRDLSHCVNVITPALDGKVLPRFTAFAFKTAFADEPFGHALRATVEMARNLPTIPVFHITLDSLDGDRHHCFDTHWKQLDHHPNGLRRLAGGLASLRSALKEAGLWDSTLVLTYDEFGRSPRENNDGGTEHGWANSQFLMGGRVKGGLYGKAPVMTNVHWIGGDRPVIDYRQLYTTLIESWWQGNAGGMFSTRFSRLDLFRA